MIKITIKEHKLCPKKHYKRILQLLEHHYLIALLCFCVSLYTSHSSDYGFQENFEKDLERSGDGAKNHIYERWPIFSIIPPRKHEESDTCT